MRKIQGDTLTARERVMRTINGEPVDRVPIFDMVQNKELMEHVSGKKLTIENGMEVLLTTIRESLDATRGVCPPMPERTWRDEGGFVYRGEWWTTWLIERPFKNTEELLEFIRKDIDRIQRSISDKMITFAGAGDVWGRDDKSSEDPNADYKKLQAQLENVVLFPSESPVGLDTAYHRAGMELFCYAYMENPELVSAWLDALNQHEVQRVHRCADPTIAPVALVYSDFANKNGPMFSPDFLRLEFFPRLKRLVDAWHEHGVKVIFHSDGDYTCVLDDFRAVGVDGINPIEPLESKDHLKVSRDGWPEFTLMGGIDCSNLLPYGSNEEVVAAVKHALEVTRPNQRYILGSSTEIHPACRLDNILTMWDAALTHGRF